MKLYVKPMDSVVVEVEPDGRVRLDNEDWRIPTLQERRAIIYAARDSDYAMAARAAAAQLRDQIIRYQQEKAVPAEA